MFFIFFSSTSGAGMDLSSRKSREQWESTVCKTVIDPVLQVSLDTDKSQEGNTLNHKSLKNTD